MYYLLKLEVNEKLEKGSVVIELENKKSFQFMKFNEVNLNRSGLFWDGKSIFRNISDRYKVGGVLETDIFNIDYSYFAIDERGLGDFIHEDVEDLFENCFIDQWLDLDKPIVFLMRIQGYTVWTDCGDEYDVEHEPVNVVTHDDFLKLVNNNG